MTEDRLKIAQALISFGETLMTGGLKIINLAIKLAFNIKSDNENKSE